MGIAGLILAWWLTSTVAGEGAVDFERQVAPLLERRCLSCHDAEQHKGRLDLSTRATMLAEGRRGAVVVPGDPDESRLLDAVSGDEPRMPKVGAPLEPAEVEVLRAWIADGAPWPEGRTLASIPATPDTDWWSLQPLVAPAVPDTGSDWPRTPVDSFVLEALNDAGLAPSAEADRRTLIRRLCYDLIGLPPTPEEVSAFVKDPAPDAYERLVDRLLASPRYAERWGRHWLDVVHYGETHGYDKDKPRPNAWPYRDYVIRSFDEDRPYARFVTEQLAGDVLEPDDPDAVVATGFVAAGPWDFVGHVELREGTVDKAITRSLDRDDMVMTALSTFASTTVHCARCHDHKFDPIPQLDYYRLQAVFAGVERADRPYDADPVVMQRRRTLRDEDRRLERRAREVEALYAAATGPEVKRCDAQLAAIEQRLAALPPLELAGGEESPTLGYHGRIASAPDTEQWVQVDLGRAVALEQVALVPAHVVYGGHPGPGFGFPVRFRVELSSSADFESRRVLFDQTSADLPNPGDAPVVIDAAGPEGRYLRVTATRLWPRTGDWVFALSELVALSDGHNVAAGAPVTALDSIEDFGWGARALTDGATSQRRLPAVGLAEGLAATRERAALAADRERLRVERAHAVEAAADPAVRAERDALHARRQEIAAELEALPAPSWVYAATRDFAGEGQFQAPDGPRPVHLLYRGDVRSPGEEVTAGALSCLPGLARHFEDLPPEDEGARRAALAQWLVDPDNPLTWRSIVNRVWHYHFGRGIVDTPNDFGRMGSPPTHPELLDWLAVWFRDGGGSFKALHLLLVTSAVYRQESRGRPEAAPVDAGNRLLWRMQRRRLEAEAVRDAVLFVAGRLDLTMGGPSDPQFGFTDDHSPRYDYAAFDVAGAGTERRSVYRFLVRSVPDPFFECMDCADASLLTPVRSTTLTALQALTMLNHPFMLEGARQLAARVADATDDPAEQVRQVWSLTLGRGPTAEEARLAREHLERHGLASLCRLAFNLDEFLFVD